MDPRKNTLLAKMKHDCFTDINYMKGRFQLATYAKFNRPDPMRDWDWLRPHTLNLYEYVSNDPINRWDPFGFDDFTDDLGVRALMVAQFGIAGYGNKQTERSAYYDGVKGRRTATLWPWSAENNKETMPYPPAQGMKNVHTHPNNRVQGVSLTGDVDWADAHKVPLYVIFRGGVDKYDPSIGGNPTQEIKGQGWYQDFMDANPDLVEKAVTYLKAGHKATRAVEELNKVNKKIAKKTAKGKKVSSRLAKKLKKKEQAATQALKEKDKASADFQEQVKLKEDTK